MDARLSANAPGAAALHDPVAGWRGGAWGFPAHPLRTPNDRKVWSGLRTAWVIYAAAALLLVSILQLFLVLR